MEFLEHLAQEVEKTGHGVQRGGTSFSLESINLQIGVTIGEKQEHNLNNEYSVVYQLSIKVSHSELFPDGIWDCLAGVGANDDEAFSNAAQSWVWGSFLVIHEILVPTETKDFNVSRLDLLTRNLETGEEFAWKLFLGPLQAAGEYYEIKDSFEETILVQKLLSSISSVAVEKRLIWIKIYIGKVNNEINCDCWLNNQDWIEGLNDLYWFAEELPGSKNYAAVKQFIIIKPCEISDLNNPQKIRNALPPAAKPGFFSRLFGRWK
jgi:hypothetical protein